MDDIIISKPDVRKLLSAGSTDAVLLYLCEKGEVSPQSVGLDGIRLETAAAFLRQVGLWQLPAPRFQQSSEAPVFSEDDVTRALSDPASRFRDLEQQLQRQLGKVLSVEDLKILLSMSEYLGLPHEVISILVSYCIERSRSRGSNRRPSFRTIEREAYRWADDGIDTIEAAAAYVQMNAARTTRVQAVCKAIGLSGRALTNNEEQYILDWLGLGFDAEAIKLAYEKTCVNTGQLKWPYMNSILKSWDAQKLHTVDEIKQFDRPAQKPGKNDAFQQHGEALTPLMRQAAEKLLSEEEEDPADGIQ